jgi:hypothetical protein
MLRDLHAWLLDEPELRGRVRLREAPIAPGELGPAADALQLVLGAGGGAATAASVIIAWLRSRSGEVTVKLTRGDETLEVTAKGVKGLDPVALRELSTHITKQLDTHATTDERR